MRRLSLRETPLRALFVVTAFFPWVSFNTNSLDMQPWPLFFALAILAIDRKMILSRTLLYSAGFVTIGFLGSLVRSHSVNFLAVRAFYEFFSFYIFFAATNSIIRRRYDIRPFVKVLNFIWLIGAMVEIRFPTILSIFGKVRTSSGRGVTSFAPEPSFFVAFLIFSSVLMLILDDYSFKRSRLFHLFNIIAILLLAKSAIGMAYLSVIILCYLGYLLIRFRPVKHGVYIVISFVLLISVVPALLDLIVPNTRALNLLVILENIGPLELIKLDASINERVAHVVLPIHAAIQNYLLPMGFDTFSEIRLQIQTFYNGLFWQATGTDKIMSWFGEWIYTLGAFGAISLSLLYLNLSKMPKEGKWTLAAVSVILLSAIPVSFPLVGVVFAYMSEKIRDT